MRYVLIYIFLGVISNIFAQTYPVPVATFDTMVFEIVKGRACQTLATAQANELQTQGAELLQTNVALNLSQSLTEARTNQVKELEQALSKTEEKSLIDVKGAKRRGRLQGLGIGGIAVILVLLL